MEPIWNFFDPRSKETVLDVLRREVDETFGLVADPGRRERRRRARTGRSAT